MELENSGKGVLKFARGWWKKKEKMYMMNGSFRNKPKGRKMANESIENMTDETFQKGVESGTTLVDFYADWCGPCRMLAPVIEEVAEEMEGKVEFKKLDIENNQKVAGQFEVTSVPTLILFKDGKEVNRIVGLRDAKAIKQFIATA